MQAPLERGFPRQEGLKGEKLIHSLHLADAKQRRVLSWLIAQRTSQWKGDFRTSDRCEENKTKTSKDRDKRRFSNKLCAGLYRIKDVGEIADVLWAYI